MSSILSVCLHTFVLLANFKMDKLEENSNCGDPRSKLETDKKPRTQVLERLPGLGKIPRNAGKNE